MSPNQAFLEIPKDSSGASGAANFKGTPSNGSPIKDPSGYGQVSAGPAAVMTLVINETIELYMEMMNSYNLMSDLQMEVQASSGQAGYTSALDLGNAQAKATRCDMYSNIGGALVDTGTLVATKLATASNDSLFQSKSSELKELEELRPTVNEKFASLQTDPEIGPAGSANNRRPSGEVGDRIDELKSGNFKTTSNINPDITQTPAEWRLKSATEAVGAIKSKDDIVQIKEQLDSRITDTTKDVNTARLGSSSTQTFVQQEIGGLVKQAVNAGAKFAQANAQKEAGQAQAAQTIASTCQQIAGGNLESIRPNVNNFRQKVDAAISALRAASNAYPQG